MKVQSIDRAFDIMEHLSREPEGLSLTMISQKLNLPTSTVFRLLSVLRDRNYIDKNDTTNVYKLGLGFLELTSMYLGSLELKTEAKPYLRRLSQQTGQVVFMGIEQQNELVYIDKYDQFNERNNYCFIGQRHQLYCTALGKSLLIGHSNEDIRMLYEHTGLAPYTEKTITDIDELIKQIEQNRERGYSIDDEENVMGIYCVASPVYDYRGVIIAAVSTSWHLDSKEVHDRERNIALVKETAFEISTHMGYINRSIFEV
jgi:DNA-binding IclR family transcriptional regulator